MPRISKAHGLMLLAALLAAALATLADPSDLAQGRAASHCGTERWSVKTLTDHGAAQVDLGPKPGTVEQLVALPVPAGFGPNAARLPPEFQAYVVKATLGEFKEEADSDIHLVLLGASGQSMIAEIPDPGCAQGSRVQTQISQVRAWFVGRFGQPSRTSWHRVNAPLTVTGVLFFDVPHGQTGAAPNAVELHPVIEIGP
jgi:hypothetical protein